MCAKNWVQGVRCGALRKMGAGLPSQGAEGAVGGLKEREREQGSIKHFSCSSSGPGPGSVLK